MVVNRLVVLWYHSGMTEEVMYDVVVVGAGVAGLTATLYATMYGLKTICVGNEIGGKLTWAPGIIDYPGLPIVSGKDLVAGLYEQVQKMSGHVVQGIVQEVVVENSQFIVTAGVGQYRTSSIIFATGNPNKQREQIAVPLAQKLGCELRGKLFTVNQWHMTTVSGVFAAGDCVVYPYGQEQIVSAAQGGVGAAASTFHFLRKSPPPILWGKSQIARQILSS